MPYILKSGRILRIRQGKANICSSLNSVSSFYVFLDPPLNLLLETFWTVDQVASHPKLLSKCEKIYINMTNRDHTGRFVVSPPFKNDELPGFGESFSQPCVGLDTLKIV